MAYPKPSIGDAVTFNWEPSSEQLTGTVVDTFQWQPGNIRYGVRVDGATAIDPTGCSGGRVYDVWPEYLVKKGN
jgi:hypothetical protein